MKTVKTCKASIEKLRVENEQKEREIEKKKQQLDILKQKSKRIEKEKRAVEAYQKFLEQVRDDNSDDYPEIMDILNRHKTLKDNQVLLDHQVKQITEDFQR